MGAQPSFAAAWLQQRMAGARAVTEVEDAELRALSPEEALHQSDALLALAPSDLPPERTYGSGIVEQQRLLLRARR